MIRVAVGLLRDTAGCVLINQRKPDDHHPGCWEFPGGKFEPGEAAPDALKRELCEELGIDVVSARPRIKLRHQYSDRGVALDVWDVTVWRGEVHGREGHPLRWVSLAELNEIDLLEADVPIVTSLCLPSLYAVTPPAEVFGRQSAEDWLSRLSCVDSDGDVLMQLRLPELGDGAYEIVASVLAQQGATSNVRLVLNGDPAIVMPLARNIGAAGVQIPARHISSLKVLRDDAAGLLIGASCHNAEELEAATEQSVDFAVLGSVNPTTSHPGADVLGWSGFASLVRETNLPVYAIGGVSPGDRQQAWEYGAQGVAGISGFWGLDL